MRLCHIRLPVASPGNMQLHQCLGAAMAAHTHDCKTLFIRQKRQGNYTILRQYLPQI